jgi:hypothetical protein
LGLQEILLFTLQRNLIYNPNIKQRRRKYVQTYRSRSHAEEIKEIWKLFKETDRKFQETNKLLSEKFRETDKLLTEKFQDTDRKFPKTRDLVNSLTDKWGRFVEGLVAPGVIRMFQERGINIEQTFQRAGALRDGKKMEIDVICVSDRDIPAIGGQTHPWRRWCRRTHRTA